MRASSYGLALNPYIVTYCSPDYEGYTLAPIRKQIMQCYFAIICIYIV